jgi:alpha/beta superfamily hydrolase
LTLFNTSIYQASLVTLLQTPGLDILLIYGTEDEFTADSKYDAWVKDLEKEAKSELKVVRVEDATHFWQGEAKLRMHETVFTWIDELPRL